MPDNYKIIFLQGGASLQFSMLPMNLLPEGGSADYILTGAWSQAAIKEACKLGKARVAASTEAANFNRIPAQTELELDPAAAYLHFTSNNTIFGTQWPAEPVPVGDVPLVCDASSDIFSRPLDITRYGLVYAGTHKNMGVAGATVVIIRDDLLERVPDGLASMLDYRLMAQKASMFNTPPTFAIYACGLVLDWLLSIGGLEEIGRRNRAKAERLYAAIDNSGGFYRGLALPGSRSEMNVTFRLPDESLEIEFARQATRQGLDRLAGHRLVGRNRASIYNAFPLEGVEALCHFMAEFQAGHS